MDLDNIPETKKDLLKEIGKFDLRGPANFRLICVVHGTKNERGSPVFDECHAGEHPG